MANLQEIIPAIFTGPNGERLTPEQIAQRQQIAQSLIGRATDTSPDAGGWASVLTKGLLGFQSGRDRRAADNAITANAAAEQSLISDMLGSLGGGAGFPSAVAAGASPTSVAAVGEPVAIPSAPEIRQGLIDRGLQPHIADAFILNFQDESGLNPGINEKNPIVPGSRGGYGLYQLTGPRRREYEAFAAQRGVNPADVNAQLDFLMNELQGSEAGAAKSILSAPDTATAAQAIVNNFLRPAPEHRQARAAKYARVATTPQEAIEKVSPKGGATIAAGQYTPQYDPLAIPANGAAATFGGPQLVYDDQGMRFVNEGEDRVSSLPSSQVAPYDFASDPSLSVASALVNPTTRKGSRLSPAGSFNDRWNAGAATAPIVPEQAIPASANIVPELTPMAATEATSSADPRLLALNDQMLGGALSPSGASSVAQSLSGAFPSAPSADRAPVTSQPFKMPAQSQSGGINPAIIQALSSPYVSNQGRQIAGMLLGQQLQQQQAAQEQQRLMAQRQATAQTLGINPALAGDADAWKAAIEQATRNRNTVTVGNTVYDANTGQPIIQGAQERFTTITGPQAQQLGLDPNKAYNVGPDGKITPIAESGVTVNVGGGEKFDEKLAELDAKAIGDVDTAGRQAIRNLGRINQLDELLKASPSGIDAAIRQRAGEWGIKTEGLDTLQAAQAAINSLVPEQRPAGSGPMSDADLELFKQSLPRTINQPGGNELIINTMRGIAQYDAKGAEIIQQLRARQISREDAFRLLNERKNPLDEFKAAQAGQAAPTGSDGWRDVGNGIRIRPKGSN